MEQGSSTSTAQLLWGSSERRRYAGSVTVIEAVGSLTRPLSLSRLCLSRSTTRLCPRRRPLTTDTDRSMTRTSSSSTSRTYCADGSGTSSNRPCCICNIQGIIQCKTSNNLDHQRSNLPLEWQEVDKWGFQSYLAAAALAHQEISHYCCLTPITQKTLTWLSLYFNVYYA